LASLVSAAALEAMLSNEQSASSPC